MGKIKIYKLKEYLLTGLGIIIIGLFIDMDFSLVFLGMYLAAPILSIGGAFAVVKKLEVSIDIQKTVLLKGEKGKISVTVTNHSLPPVLGLEVILTEENHIQYLGKDRYHLSIGGRQSLSYDKEYQAVMWGECNLKAAYVTVTDLFGFISFQEAVANLEKIKKTIKIVPDIPDVLIEDECIWNCFRIADDTQDEKESRESLDQRSAMPGYEYREYQPGDPIKRINWKLSERRGKYMLRLDDYAMCSPPVFILDAYVDTDAWPVIQRSQIIYMQQRVLEGMLGTIKEFIENGSGCELYCFFEGEIQQISLNAMEDLGALQWKMSRFQFEHNSYRSFNLYDRIPDSRGGYIIFTAGMNERLKSQIKILGNQVITVIGGENLFTVPDMFLITEEFHLQRITG